MIASRILTGISIPFFDPYVIRVEHEGSNGFTDMVEFRKLLKRVRNNTYGSWGYCNPEPEYRTPLEHTNHAGYDNVVIMYSYWVFKYKSDGLQFLLSTQHPTQMVTIWPRRLFTIYEVDGTDIDELPHSNA